MCKCAVKILHIRQMPLPKGMLLGSDSLQNPHPGRVGHDSDRWIIATCTNYVDKAVLIMGMHL